MPSEQANRIIEKFGGAPRLAKAIGVGVSTIYKWTYPAERKGCDGFIPRKHHERIKEAADFMDINLTEEDWKI